MSQTARVGLLMLVALMTVGIFIIKIEQIPLGAKGNREKIKAVFPSVAGLDEKSPVRIAGVRVGIVDHIALDGDRAIVTLALEQGIVLHQGAYAEVTGLGMLGDKYIELYPGNGKAAILAKDVILEGSSPVGFDQVLKTANGIGGDVKAVTESLRKSLGGDEGQKRLDEIIENIRQLSGDLKLMVASNRFEVDTTIRNFQSFSQTLKDELPKLAEKLNGLADRVDSVVGENRANLSETIANIKDLSARLRISVDNINQISTKIANGEGSIGKLVNDDTTVNNLNSTLKSVESGVESLKNTIGRFEKFRLDVNLRTESLPSLVSENSSRTAFGIDLHTTPKRFFRIEMVDSPFGRTRNTTESVVTTYPDGHQETVTQTRKKTTDSYTINAQVGFHLSYFTVRAGLFESKGGVGIDKELFKSRLRMSFEAYDFSRSTKPPHLRIEGRYFLTKNIFAYAGWDDPRWSQRRSVIFGGGVTWQDDDLKYLMGTAASLGGR